MDIQEVIKYAKEEFGQDIVRKDPEVENGAVVYFIKDSKPKLRKFITTVFNNYIHILTLSNDTDVLGVIKWLYQYRIDTVNGSIVDPSIFTRQVEHNEENGGNKTPEELLKDAKSLYSNSILRETTLNVAKDVAQHNGYSTLKDDYIIKPYTKNMLFGTLSMTYELISCYIVEATILRLDTLLPRNPVTEEYTLEEINDLLDKAIDSVYRDLEVDWDLNVISSEKESITVYFEKNISRYGIAYLQTFFRNEVLYNYGIIGVLSYLLTIMIQVGATMDMFLEIANKVNEKASEGIKAEKEKLDKINQELEDEGNSLKKTLAHNLKPFMLQMFQNGLAQNPDAVSLDDIEEMKNIFIQIRKDIREAKGLPSDSKIIL